MDNDLISRSALMDALRETEFCMYFPLDEIDSVYVPLDEIDSVIDNAPAVNAEPVQHGRWIDRGDYITTAYGSLDIKVCSNCNAEVTLDEYDYYCPNCGAKMDADAKG